MAKTFLKEPIDLRCNGLAVGLGLDVDLLHVSGLKRSSDTGLPGAVRADGGRHGVAQLPLSQIFN